jgi:bacillithiol system protein YtxJ
MVIAKDIRTIPEFNAILEESFKIPVVLCKFSPICPVSSEAENQFYEYLKTNPQGISFYKIDVVYCRDTSRSLAKAIDVKHESPQALLFKEGKCTWHDSHYHLTKEKFLEKLK